MHLSGRAKLCLVGLTLGAVFGLVLGAVVVVALRFSGVAALGTIGPLELVGWIAALCAVGGLTQGWSSHSEP
jgi:hypothetical protein